ncbi:MAG: hypothetical protein N4A53_04795 [Pelagimonas sp.]|jgi:hypothetical protein|nr:hypothetical protein [Pelagimonas sp.]
MSARTVSGLVALALFLMMALALQTCVAPLTADRFLPQASWAGYDRAQLGELALALRSAPFGGRPDLVYGAVVGLLDSGFILAFGAWTVMSLAGWRGWALALGYAALDLAENTLLLQAVGWFGAAPELINATDAALAPAAFFTKVKLPLAALILILSTLPLLRAPRR